MSEYNATKKAMEVMNIGYDLADNEWKDKIRDKIKELEDKDYELHTRIILENLLKEN